jgi:MFS transporter, DHA1 family, tetracycline resistance protein
MSAPVPEVHSKARQAGVNFVFVTVALDMVAFGLALPVLPLLITQMAGGDDAHGAVVYGVFGTVWAALQFLCSPVLGAVSDNIGRRPVLLFSNFALGIQYVILALAPGLAILLLGRIISGIASASVTTANAYIADVTPPDKRAAAFGLMGAAFGVGFVLGPALGGLLGDVNPRLPFWCAAVASFAAGFYGLFILPESLPKDRRSPIQWRKANPVGVLTFLREQTGVAPLAFAKFFSDLGHVVLPSTFVLYAAHRFEWGPKEVGLTLGVVGVLSIVVQAGLVGRVVRWIGAEKALMLGLGAGVIAFVVYGLASEPWMLFVGVAFGSIYGFAGAATQTLLTQRVSPKEQGRLQGALGGLTGLATLFGPAIFTGTLAAFIADGAVVWLPGAAFLLAALFLVVSGVLAWFAIADRKAPAMAVVSPSPDEPLS